MTKREFLERYGKDHLIVYGGNDIQASLFSSGPKPIPEGKRLLSINSATVYIDGMNFGSLGRPFSCFDVGPGMHRFELWGHFGRYGNVSTDVRPARVREDCSLMIAVKSVECLQGVFFSIKEFTDLDEFLKYIGESL